MRKMAKLNVAIADDNERILTMLDEVLTADDDITVVGTARNGEQAYEMILDKKPDVVLLDLVMPGIDGLGVMDKVHAEKNADPMPSFIIISGIQNESVAENAMSAGATYYIMKPFDNFTLLNRVKQLGRRGYDMRPQLLTQSTALKEPAFIYGGQGKSLEQYVTSVIHEIGVPAHIKGYQYLRDCYDEEVMLDFSDIRFMEKFRKIYPKFYAIGEIVCLQDFSIEEQNLSKLMMRYKIFLYCALACKREHLLDYFSYFFVTIKRTVHLLWQTHSFSFLSVYVTNYLLGKSEIGNLHGNKKK